MGIRTKLDGGKETKKKQFRKERAPTKKEVKYTGTKRRKIGTKDENQ